MNIEWHVFMAHSELVRIQQSETLITSEFHLLIFDLNLNSLCHQDNVE